MTREIYIHENAPTARQSAIIRPLLVRMETAAEAEIRAQKAARRGTVAPPTPSVKLNDPWAALGNINL